MKNVVKSILFVAIFIAILEVASFISTPKNSTKLGVNHFLREGIPCEENTLDALFVGDSLVYTAISPQVIFDDYGFTSYDLATSAQYIYQSYHVLKKSLETQKPKIIFLETNVFFRKYDKVQFVGMEAKKYFPIFEYHNRWKNVSLSNLVGNESEAQKKAEKGYRYTTKINAPDKVKKNYMKKQNKTFEINDFNAKYIDKFIKLCKKNNIEIILLSTPTMKNMNYSKYNAIKDIANKYQVEHLDLNLEHQLDIDWHNDTQDKGDHLNYYGAYKVSEYLGEYLQKKGLEDHRNDINYHDWIKTN